MSQTKLIIIGSLAGLVVLILLLILVFFFGGLGAPPAPQSVTLQFWGVYDDVSFYNSAITDFQKTNPSIRIAYRQFNFADYESQLINSFAAGTGPDIWLMHNTWLPKHIAEIQPLPQQVLSGAKVSIFTIKQFQDQFVDGALNDLTQNSQIYALPIYMDSMALYYNKDLFNTAGIAQPPKTWDEFNDDVKKLTVLDSHGNIVRAGAAIGTASNINRSTDILGLLMMQSGVKMTDDSHRSAAFALSVGGQNVGETALQYYTDFANSTKQVYTWNDQQQYSIDAFAGGNAAMMFNYSHEITTIRSKSARFNFGIAPMPQIAGSQVAVNYANYWAPTVSKQSKNAVAAWKFLVYLSSAKGAGLYLTASGRPSARRDLIEQEKGQPDIGVFAEQALSAKCWYQVNSSAIETIFANMIDDVNFGRASARDALDSAQNKVNVLMQRSQNGP
jgi:multiple sugar transport system substrate-binding protein